MHWHNLVIKRDLKGRIFAWKVTRAGPSMTQFATLPITKTILEKQKGEQKQRRLMNCIYATWLTKRKKTDISGGHCFPREMTSKKRAKKFHTDDMSLPRPGYSFWLVFPHGEFASTNQKHCADLGSNTSSVWNFCARSSIVISRGNLWWRREISAVFSSYRILCLIIIHTN